MKYKLHYRLAKYIIKLGDKEPKRHGSKWTFSLDGCEYKLDDYSYAIHLNGFYVGMDFGGFSSALPIDRYKYHIGKLFQYWLKNKR